MTKLREWFRYWTVRLQTVCASIGSWLVFDPVSLLNVINMIPCNVRVVLSHEVQVALQILGGVLVVLSLIIAFTRTLPEHVKRPPQ